MTVKKKWNMLDVIIIVVIIIAIAVFLGRDKLFNSGEVAEAISGKVTIYYEAEAFKLMEEAAMGFKVGDKITAQNKYQDGVIEKIEIRNTVKTKVAADGTLVAYEDPLEKVAVIGIRAEANKYGPYIEVGGQAIKVGSSYYIKTDHSEVFGRIKWVEVIE